MHHSHCSNIQDAYTMDILRNLCRHLFDILKIYIKLGLITLVVYFVAEWYILRYDDDDFDTLLTKASEHTRPIYRNNSTAVKMISLIYDFFFR